MLKSCLMHFNDVGIPKNTVVLVWAQSGLTDSHIWSTLSHLFSSHLAHKQTNTLCLKKRTTFDSVYRDARLSLFSIRILPISVTNYPYPYTHDRRKKISLSYPYPFTNFSITCQIIVQYLKDVFGSTVLAINRPNFRLLFTGLVSKAQVDRWLSASLPELTTVSVIASWPLENV